MGQPFPLVTNRPYANYTTLRLRSATGFHTPVAERSRSVVLFARFFASSIENDTAYELARISSGKLWRNSNRCR